jgi:bacterioferritin-associated ferredoxin
VIVCVCRRVSDRAVGAAIDAGARTVEDVARVTGAGTSCGCCRPAIDQAVRAHGACSDLPCVACPRAQAQAARREAA